MNQEEEWNYDRKRVLSYLNNYLEFQNPQLKREYYEHCKGNGKLTLLMTAICVVVTLISLPTNLAALPYNSTLGEWIFSLVMIVILLVGIVNGWLLLLHNSFSNKPFFQKLEKYIPVMQLIFYFIYDLFLIWVMCRNFLVENCNHYPTSFRHYLVGWHCDLPTNYALYPMMSILSVQPILNFLTFNESKFNVVLLMMLLCNGPFMIISAYNRHVDGVWMIIAWTIIIGVVLQEIHLFRVSHFLSVKKLQETITENKRMQEENRAIELRHMIGNLAHDLKTVSTHNCYLSRSYNDFWFFVAFVFLHHWN